MARAFNGIPLVAFLATLAAANASAEPIRVGNYIALHPVNYPTMSVRHKLGLARINDIVTPLDLSDSTFLVVPGLADPRAVSLQSANYPGSYLRHRDSKVWLDPFTDNTLYRQDATFRIVLPLAGRADSSSLQSYNHPTRYLRHREGLMYVHEYAPDELFKRDASFSAERFPSKNEVLPLNDSDDLTNHSRLIIQSTAARCRYYKDTDSHTGFTDVQLSLDLVPNTTTLTASKAPPQRQLSDFLSVELTGQTSCGSKAFRLKTSAGRYLKAVSEPHGTTGSALALVYTANSQEAEIFAMNSWNAGPTADLRTAQPAEPECSYDTYTWFVYGYDCGSGPYQDRLVVNDARNSVLSRDFYKAISTPRAYPQQLLVWPIP